ncbi:MAG: BMP family ABC transporter substrate-binding protein [Treponema sp.]|jgi:simple sugar transport system substrate-binding protein|nr:BMP family ABC transporter substrate-binding protein [Treponema sp.]
MKPLFARSTPFFAAALFTVVIFSAPLSGCGVKSAPDKTASGKTIGVFIPGVISGSPVYEMLAVGVQAAAESRAGVTLVEGGYNQAEWENKVTAMAASASYDLIVSANPSLPGIVASVSQKFPRQYFLLLDGELPGNPSVYTLRYNQREQGYMAGYMAAMVTEEFSQNGAGLTRRIGLVAAQEYPVMNDIILPGYLEGARAINPDYQADFRIVGNWYDAARAEELAADMIRGGVKVILAISGGANEGIIQASHSAGTKVLWFDNNGYNVRPGTVVGCAVLAQDKAAYNQVRRWLDGELPFGKAETLGVADQYVDFIQDDPDYILGVSEDIRKKQAAMIERIKSGDLVLD